MQMGRITLNHWQVENNVHWLRDAVCDEDDCRSRNPNSACALALLRTALLAAVRASGRESLTQAIEEFAADRHLAVALITNNDLDRYLRKPCKAKTVPWWGGRRADCTSGGVAGVPPPLEWVALHAVGAREKPFPSQRCLRRMTPLFQPWLQRHRSRIIPGLILRQQLRKEELPVVYAHQQSDPTRASLMLPLILRRWKLHLSSHHHRHFGSNIIRKRLAPLAPNLEINDGNVHFA